VGGPSTGSKSKSEHVQCGETTGGGTTTGGTTTGGTTGGGTSGGGTTGSGGVIGSTTGGTTGGTAETGGELPFTGLPVWIPVLLAFALLASGGFLLRRKRDDVS
jgi:LPXTG-motif cell wall-anchored protein